MSFGTYRYFPLRLPPPSLPQGGHRVGGVRVRVIAPPLTLLPLLNPPLPPLPPCPESRNFGPLCRGAVEGSESQDGNIVELGRNAFIYF